MRSGKASQRRENCLESGRSILLHGFCKRGGFRACGRDQRAFRSPFGNLRPHTGWRPCKLRNRKVLLQRYSWNKHAFFGSLNCLERETGDWGMVFHWELAPLTKWNYFLGIAASLSIWSVAPPARGAGGIPTSPLCPPGPPIPPSNGRGIPPDPPCAERGTSPCVSTDRVRIGHAIWFGLGPATNRVPRRVHTLHGSGAGARTAARWPCRGGPMPTLQG